MSSVLNDKEMDNVLNKLIDTILKADPTLKLAKDERETLVKSLRESITKENGGKLEKNKLEDPKFVNWLKTTVELSIKMQQKQGLWEQLMKILNPKLTPEERFKDKKLTKEELKKRFTPEELKKMLEITKQLKLTMKDGLKNKLKPKPNAKKKTEDSPEDDMANLLGLINHHQTGCIAIVVQVCKGNLAGFVDQSSNPNSMAQIDNTNKDTSVLGDPLGMKAIVAENEVSSGEASNELIKEVVGASRMAPQLTRGN